MPTPSIKFLDKTSENYDEYDKVVYFEDDGTINYSKVQKNQFYFDLFRIYLITPISQTVKKTRVNIND